MNLKIGDILIAKRDCIMIHTKANALIIGKEYPITSIDNGAIFIESEISKNHRFTTD